MKQTILASIIGILVIFTTVQYAFSYPPTIQEVRDGCTKSLRDYYNVEPTQAEVEACTIMFYQDMNSPNKLTANSTYSEVKQKCLDILRGFIHDEPEKISVDICVGGALEDLHKQ